MRMSAPISPRPLSSAERLRIERAQAQIREAQEEARALVRDAIAKRDAEIAAAVRAGAYQSEIARLLSVSRQAVYDAVKRAKR